MADPPYAFSDGRAYDRFIGRWSESVAPVFLNWLMIEGGRRWLDVGCGTGAFTRLIAETAQPASLVAIDPSEEQIRHARARLSDKPVELRVADAQALPFPDAAFDVVASALVINFIPDRPKALSEMRRVAARGGLVAGYVWDFAGGRAPGSPVVRTLRELGHGPASPPGAGDTRLDALIDMFRHAGLGDVAAREITVSLEYPDFEELWTSLTPGYTATTKLLRGLAAAEQDRVRDLVRQKLVSLPDGRVSFSSVANAVSGRVS